jgi:hypothetical protein
MEQESPLALKHDIRPDRIKKEIPQHIRNLSGPGVVAAIRVAA